MPARHGALTHRPVVHLCGVRVGASIEVVLLCVSLAEVLPLDGVL